jgi:hypothetical protein
MEFNPFYITPETIMNRLSRVHKDKIFTLPEVIEWSAECVTEYIEDYDYFVPYSDIELIPESNGRFYLPCLVYRIMDIHDGKNRIAYEKHAGYIKPRDKSIAKMYLNYIGIPVTDEGDILIDKNHAQACEAFIIHKLYYEDYLKGRLHPNMWQDIKLTLENELLAARASYRHIDQGRLETLAAIRGNIVPRIAQVPLFQLYNIGK